MTAATGPISLAGCTGDTGPTATASPPGGGDDDDQNPCPGDTPTPDGPQKPYDSLSLHRMPGYVSAYPESVIVQYRAAGAAAQRAVQQALTSEGTYHQCTSGRDRTDVMALFSHIERRWQQAGGSSFEHTYLHYEEGYYGIVLVQEGDFVRVDSIPCTSEACPTTPTPPA